jgi:hypothetical protein
MNTNIIKQNSFKPINFNLQHVDLCFNLNSLKTRVTNIMIFTTVLGDIYLDEISIDNSRKKINENKYGKNFKKKVYQQIHLRSLIILLNLKL